MREYMASHGVTLLARDASGTAIGMLTGFVQRDFGIFEEVMGHIDNAFVYEAHRRGGVGRALLQRFEAWCRQRGATEVRLEVAQGNDLGLGFWRKSGYEPRQQVLGRMLGRAL
jgi:GNAT superfamily N-acetyltransferase